MITATPLGRENLRDFLGLFDEAGCKDCYCVAWHRPSWDDFDAAQAANRSDRIALVAGGASDGFLYYEATRCIGWCQATRAEGLANLGKTFPALPLAGRHAITCLRLLPAWHGRGLGTTMVGLARDGLLAAGATSILAFPARYQAFAAEAQWTGTVGIFQRNGFRVIAEDRAGPVMEYAAPG
jgi:GNAT superfamily N-acetyltransferase